jgi:hypothetical protein
MSFTLYNLDRGIDSDDATGFNKKAILYDKSDINKLIYHHKEKLNHFSAKAILFMVLRELMHNVVSEVKIEMLVLEICLIFQLKSYMSSKLLVVKRNNRE